MANSTDTSPLTDDLPKAKTRNLRKDALFFSGLILDKRFKMTVRYVDWVDLNAASSEMFSGAYVLYGPVEIAPDKGRVLIVRAAQGSISDRKSWVQVMELKPSGFIVKTDISADASVEGWEQSISKQVLRLLLRIKHQSSGSRKPVVEESSVAQIPMDAPSVALKAGGKIEIVCSQRLAELHARMPDRSPQAIIDYALFQVSLEDYLDD